MSPSDQSHWSQQVEVWNPRNLGGLTRVFRVGESLHGPVSAAYPLGDPDWDISSLWNSVLHLQKASNNRAFHKMVGRKIQVEFVLLKTHTLARMHARTHTQNRPSNSFTCWTILPVTFLMFFFFLLFVCSSVLTKAIPCLCLTPETIGVPHHT